MRMLFPSHDHSGVEQKVSSSDSLSGGRRFESCPRNYYRVIKMEWYNYDLLEEYDDRKATYAINKNLLAYVENLPRCASCGHLNNPNFFKYYERDGVIGTQIVCVRCNKILEF